MIATGRWSHIVAAALVLGAYFVVATAAMRSKSNTFDEIAHLTAGYSYWTYNDYRLQPENGNWSQRAGGLAAAVGGARFPERDNPAWRGSDVYAVGDRFFFKSGNDLEGMLFRARATIALLAVLTGALVFAWSWRLNGAAGAWTSLLLFASCPTMLAHGAMVTSDMAAALSFAAFALSWWSVLHRITPGRLLLSAVSAAAVVLSKFSGPVLVPIALLLATVRIVRGRPTLIAVPGWKREISSHAHHLLALAGLIFLHIIVGALLIWASYGFRYSAFAQADGDTRLLVDWQMLTSGQDGAPPGVSASVINWARDQRVLPEAYLYGMAHSLKFAQARRAFMNGEYSLTGWYSFFPYAFAVKTTLPLLVLLCIAAWLAWRSGGGGGQPRRAQWKSAAYDRAPLLALIAIYAAIAVATNLNIGHRHLLPIYPPLFILAGAAGTLFTSRHALPAATPKTVKRQKNRKREQTGASVPSPLAARRAFRPAGVVIALLLGWQLVGSALAYPHYLAFFNELAGGSDQGYRRLVDSSLDWGQDLPGLKRWLDDNGLQRSGHPPVYLSYFGSADPAHYGIDAVTLLGYFDRRPTAMPSALSAGWYCVSATMLQGVYLDPMGDWGPTSEGRYQELRAPAEAFLAALRAGDEKQLAGMSSQTGERFWLDAVARYDRLRTARLLAYLRQRKPVASAGHSILIYKLTDAEVSDAVFGPPPFTQ